MTKNNYRSKKNARRIRYAKSGITGAQGIQGAEGSKGVESGIKGNKSGEWHNGFWYQYDEETGRKVHWVPTGGGKAVPRYLDEVLEEERKAQEQGIAAADYGVDQEKWNKANEAIRRLEQNGVTITNLSTLEDGGYSMTLSFSGSRAMFGEKFRTVDGVLDKLTELDKAYSQERETAAAEKSEKPETQTSPRVDDSQENDKSESNQDEKEPEPIKLTSRGDWTPRKDAPSAEDVALCRRVANNLNHGWADALRKIASVQDGKKRRALFERAVNNAFDIYRRAFVCHGDGDALAEMIGREVEANEQGARKALDNYLTLYDIGPREMLKYAPGLENLYNAHKDDDFSKGLENYNEPGDEETRESEPTNETPEDAARSFIQDESNAPDETQTEPKSADDRQITIDGITDSIKAFKKKAASLRGRADDLNRLVEVKKDYKEDASLQKQFAEKLIKQADDLEKKIDDAVAQLSTEETEREEADSQGINESAEGETSPGEDAARAISRSVAQNDEDDDWQGELGGDWEDVEPNMSEPSLKNDESDENEEIENEPSETTEPQAGTEELEEESASGEEPRAELESDSDNEEIADETANGDGRTEADLEGEQEAEDVADDGMTPEDAAREISAMADEKQEDEDNSSEIDYDNIDRCVYRTRILSGRYTSGPNEKKYEHTQDLLKRLEKARDTIKENQYEPGGYAYALEMSRVLYGFTPSKGLARNTEYRSVLNAIRDEVKLSPDKINEAWEHFVERGINTAWFVRQVATAAFGDKFARCDHQIAFGKHKDEFVPEYYEAVGLISTLIEKSDKFRSAFTDYINALNRPSFSYEKDSQSAKENATYAMAENLGRIAAKFINGDISKLTDNEWQKKADALEESWGKENSEVREKNSARYNALLEQFSDPEIVEQLKPLTRDEAESIYDDEGELLYQPLGGGRCKMTYIFDDGTTTTFIGRQDWFDDDFHGNVSDAIHEQLEEDKDFEESLNGKEWEKLTDYARKYAETDWNAANTLKRINDGRLTRESLTEKAKKSWLEEKLHGMEGDGWEYKESEEEDDDGEEELDDTESQIEETQNIDEGDQEAIDVKPDASTPEEAAMSVGQEGEDDTTEVEPDAATPEEAAMSVGQETDALPEETSQGADTADIERQIKQAEANAQQCEDLAEFNREQGFPTDYVEKKAKDWRQKAEELRSQLNGGGNTIDDQDNQESAPTVDQSADAIATTESQELDVEATLKEYKQGDRALVSSAAREIVDDESVEGNRKATAILLNAAKTDPNLATAIENWEKAHKDWTESKDRDHQRLELGVKRFASSEESKRLGKILENAFSEIVKAARPHLEGIFPLKEEQKEEEERPNGPALDEINKVRTELNELKRKVNRYKNPTKKAETKQRIEELRTKLFQMEEDHSRMLEWDEKHGDKREESGIATTEKTTVKDGEPKTIEDGDTLRKRVNAYFKGDPLDSKKKKPPKEWKQYLLKWIDEIEQNPPGTEKYRDAVNALLLHLGNTPPSWTSRNRTKYQDYDPVDYYIPVQADDIAGNIRKSGSLLNVNPDSNWNWGATSIPDCVKKAIKNGDIKTNGVDSDVIVEALYDNPALAGAICDLYNALKKHAIAGSASNSVSRNRDSLYEAQQAISEGRQQLINKINELTQQPDAFKDTATRLEQEKRDFDRQKREKNARDRMDIIGKNNNLLMRFTQWANELKGTGRSKAENDKLDEYIESVRQKVYRQIHDNERDEKRLRAGFGAYTSSLERLFNGGSSNGDGEIDPSGQYLLDSDKLAKIKNGEYTEKDWWNDEIAANDARNKYYSEMDYDEELPALEVEDDGLTPEQAAQAIGEIADETQGDEETAAQTIDDSAGAEENAPTTRVDVRTATSALNAIAYELNEKYNKARSQSAKSKLRAALAEVSAWTNRLNDPNRSGEYADILDAAKYSFSPSGDKNKVFQKLNSVRQFLDGYDSLFQSGEDAGENVEATTTPDTENNPETPEEAAQEVGQAAESAEIPGDVAAQETAKIADEEPINETEDAEENQGVSKDNTTDLRDPRVPQFPKSTKGMTEEEKARVKEEKQAYASWNKKKKPTHEVVSKLVNKYINTQSGLADLLNTYGSDKVRYTTEAIKELEGASEEDFDKVWDDFEDRLLDYGDNELDLGSRLVCKLALPLVFAGASGETVKNELMSEIDKALSQSTTKARTKILEFIKGQLEKEYAPDEDDEDDTEGWAMDSRGFVPGLNLSDVDNDAQTDALASIASSVNGYQREALIRAISNPELNKIDRDYLLYVIRTQSKNKAFIGQAERAAERANRGDVPERSEFQLLKEISNLKYKRQRALEKFKKVRDRIVQERDKGLDWYTPGGFERDFEQLNRNSQDLKGSIRQMEGVKNRVKRLDEEIQTLTTELNELSSNAYSNLTEPLEDLETGNDIQARSEEENWRLTVDNHRKLIDDLREELKETESLSDSTRDAIRKQRERRLQTALEGFDRFSSESYPKERALKRQIDEKKEELERWKRNRREIESYKIDKYYTQKNKDDDIADRDREIERAESELNNLTTQLEELQSAPNQSEPSTPETSEPTEKSDALTFDEGPENESLDDAEKAALKGARQFSSGVYNLGLEENNSRWERAIRPVTKKQKELENEPDIKKRIAGLQELSDELVQRSKTDSPFRQDYANHANFVINREIAELERSLENNGNTPSESESTAQASEPDETDEGDQEAIEVEPTNENASNMGSLQSELAEAEERVQKAQKELSDINDHISQLRGASRAHDDESFHKNQRGKRGRQISDSIAADRKADQLEEEKQNKIDELHKAQQESVRLQQRIQDETYRLNPDLKAEADERRKQEEKINDAREQANSFLSRDIAGWPARLRISREILGKNASAHDASSAGYTIEKLVKSDDDIALAVARFADAWDARKGSPEDPDLIDAYHNAATELSRVLVPRLQGEYPIAERVQKLAGSPASTDEGDQEAIDVEPTNETPEEAAMSVGNSVDAAQEEETPERDVMNGGRGGKALNLNTRITIDGYTRPVKDFAAMLQRLRRQSRLFEEEAKEQGEQDNPDSYYNQEAKRSKEKADHLLEEIQKWIDKENASVDLSKPIKDSWDDSVDQLDVLSDDAREVIKNTHESLQSTRSWVAHASSKLEQADNIIDEINDAKDEIEKKRALYRLASFLYENSPYSSNDKKMNDVVREIRELAKFNGEDISQWAHSGDLFDVGYFNYLARDLNVDQNSLKTAVEGEPSLFPLIADYFNTVYNRSFEGAGGGYNDRDAWKRAKTRDKSANTRTINKILKQIKQIINGDDASEFNWDNIDSEPASMTPEESAARAISASVDEPEVDEETEENEATQEREPGAALRGLSKAWREKQETTNEAEQTETPSITESLEPEPESETLSDANVPETVDEDEQEENERYANRGEDGYYSIDEDAAKRAQEANSFREYKPNTITNDYRALVDDARKVAEEQKKKVDPMYHERIDSILNRYERELANWYNKWSRNQASYPSWMITGRSNYNWAKNKRKSERTIALSGELEKIQDLLSDVKSVGTGGISSDDSNAVVKIENKIARLKDLQEKMKEANKYWRKNQTWEGYDGPLQISDYDRRRNMPFTFELSNNNAEIRRNEKRLQQLKATQGANFGDDVPFDGGVVHFNKEANRIQLKFDDKPDAETISKLKSNGFKWAPSEKAWQRMLNGNGIYAAKSLGYLPEDYKAKKGEEPAPTAPEPTVSEPDDRPTQYARMTSEDIARMISRAVDRYYAKSV